LTGASIGSQVAPIVDFGADSGHLILTIDVARFRDVDAFKGTVDAFLREIVGSEQVEEAPPIRYPGSAGGYARQSRRQNGIPLEEGYHKALIRLSDQFAVPLGEVQAG
jgi:LDH2 family malate/lactate/ureidoglycolate dehydrogenase